MAHGRYTIVGKIADGGMAEIFLASQRGAEGFEKPVVLKRVLTAYSADPQFRNMFIDEAHISMTLAHSNIVQVLDVGLSGERTFLVLELVEGWDLEDILARAQATGPDHPWPPSLGLYVTAQICRGLAYAHAKRAPDGRPLGIVHRDVNPTNVLISEQGEVKLADFGIAKAERKRERTAAGIIKGKIGFMSPEQSTGKALDARSDLFSTGTMLYLMLTGRKPFDAPSELESMLRSQRAEFRPPEELNPYLPAEATAIVNRAMRRDASARYQTADEMLGDVERALRTHYNSAGQTELKVWLTELARRDGVLPMGRRLAGGAVPQPGEGSASDLSAGVSVELSDVGVGSQDAGPTLVSTAAPSFDLDPPTGPRVASLPPPSPGLGAAGGVGGRTPRPVPPSASSFLMPAPLPRSVPAPTAAPAASAAVTPPPLVPVGPAAGGPSAPPLSDQPAAPGPSAAPSTVTGGPTSPPWGSPAGTDATALAAPPAPGAGPAAAGPRPLPAAPLPVAAPRMRRKSRVGLGFILGALCMLGAVFGIKWLAAWAGREGVVIPHMIGGGSGDATATADAATTTAADDSPRGSAPVEGRPAGGPQAASPSGASASATGDSPDGASSPVAAPTGTSPSTEGAAAVAAAPSNAAAPGVDAAAPLAVRPEGDRPVAGASPAAAAQGADAPAQVGDEDDEDEEALLSRVVPDAGAVVGEDEADPLPAGPARKDTRPQNSGASTQAPSPARRAPERPAATPVVVRITSSPLGAVVRTKRQVLGRTPIAIRFKPGNTYQLTFVKAGYVTNSRMLAVGSGKPKSISVPMKKKARTARRSGLFRGR